MELFRYVYDHGYNVNPLTRVTIKDNVKSRLYNWWMFVKDNNMNLPFTQLELNTPVATITYAVSELERLHGIYIQPLWLLRLDEMDILGIFGMYHQNMLNYGPNVPYMDRQTEEDSFEADNPGPSQMALGKEMIKMIQSEQAPSFYVCNMVITLAEYCQELKSTLPDWVLDAAEV
jgi:hypothetical protein